MSYNRILVVSDNHFLVSSFKNVIKDLSINEDRFTFACTSPKLEWPAENLRCINVKKDYERIGRDFDLVFSLHCKQIFPIALVNTVKCINIHPGLNPYNRGWYPQVFSILNKLPIGATIHEMDDKIDHGKVIVQKEVRIDPWDTSLDVYNKVLTAEIELLKEHLPYILENNYTAFPMAQEGNYNSVEDFRNLLEIDPESTVVVSQFIDRLRALTHGTFDNAFYFDRATGKKIFINIKLKPE